MNLYAESSAVLGWLLQQEGGEDVGGLLRGASLVVASSLALVECDRVLIRAESERAMTPAEAGERRRVLHEAALHWIVLRIGDEIVERARRAFPAEPIRTLDALHLATLVHAQSAVARLSLLSLDKRIRTSGRTLGFSVLPE